jgi:uncharacterized membrane protein YbjE (DUF340 family)
MLNIMIFLMAGLGAGYLLRKNEGVIRFSDRVSAISILLLLFLLGLSLGRNEAVLRNFSLFGVRAAALTVSGVAGSVFFSSLVYKAFFRERKNGK